MKRRARRIGLGDGARSMTPFEIERLNFTSGAISGWVAGDERRRTWPAVYVLDGADSAGAGPSTSVRRSTPLRACASTSRTLPRTHSGACALSSTTPSTCRRASITPRSLSIASRRRSAIRRSSASPTPSRSARAPRRLVSPARDSGLAPEARIRQPRRAPAVDPYNPGRPLDSAAPHRGSAPHLGVLTSERLMTLPVQQSAHLGTLAGRADFEARWLSLWTPEMPDLSGILARILPMSVPKLQPKRPTNRPLGFPPSRPHVSPETGPTKTHARMHRGGLKLPRHTDTAQVTAGVN